MSTDKLWQLIILISATILAFIYFFTPIYNNPRLMAFISALSILSSIILFIELIQSQRQTEHQQQIEREQTQARESDVFQRETENYWVDVEKMFRDNWPILAPLYNEIWESQGIKLPEITLTDEEQQKRPYLENSAAQVIFQVIENLVNTRKQEIRKGSGWYNIFLSWLNSPTIKNSWQVSKKFYNKETTTFIDGIISDSSAALQLWKDKVGKN